MIGDARPNISATPSPRSELPNLGPSIIVIKCVIVAGDKSAFLHGFFALESYITFIIKFNKSVVIHLPNEGTPPIVQITEDSPLILHGSILL